MKGGCVNKVVKELIVIEPSSILLSVNFLSLRIRGGLGIATDD